MHHPSGQSTFNWLFFVFVIDRCLVGWSLLAKPILEARRLEADSDPHAFRHEIRGQCSCVYYHRAAFYRERITNFSLRENSGWYSYVPAALAQVFLGIKIKSFFLHRVQRHLVSFFLPNLYHLISRAIPVIRLRWAEIIYRSFFLGSHTFRKWIPRLNLGKFRATEAGAKHPEYPFWCAQGSKIRI